ncbi:MAG: TauA [Firmicutes bacterium]|nr:TauA [Bacillota bacterium]
MKLVGRNIVFLMVLVLSATLIFGCGSNKSTSGTVGIPEKDKDYVVKLGYYDCDHMTAACIGKDAGIFEELGLKVNVIGNGKVPEAMAAGQMDVGYVGNTRMMRAFLQGSPIMVVANNHIGGSYYLVASNAISDPQELIGKKLAIGTDPEKNNSSWITMARKLGLPIEGKNYEVFNMADKDKFFALKAGKLDGYTSCDPWGSMAEHEKAGHIIASAVKLSNGEWGECCGFTMNRSFVAEHPELAKKMILAHTKSLEFIYTKPVRSSEIFAANYNVPLEVALMTIYKKTVAEGRTLTWKMDNKYWENQIQYELSVPSMAKAPDIKEFLQPQFLNESGANDFDTFIKEKVDSIFPVGMNYEDWKKKAYELEGKKL